MSDYTAIPLAISLERVQLTKESEDIEKCVDSILDLIIFTPKGSFAADPEFGFEYWNHEFSNVNIREFNNSYIGMMSSDRSLNDITRKQCETSLLDSIMTYEPRLLRPEVKIELDINTKVRKKNAQSKYEMRILVSGFLDDGLGVTRPYEKRISFMVEPIAKRNVF